MFAMALNTWSIAKIYYWHKAKVIISRHVSALCVVSNMVAVMFTCVCLGCWAAKPN